MATIEEIKVLLDQINAEDVAEDAAFQATIDSLSNSNTSLVAERDALIVERNTLSGQLANEITFLRQQRDLFDQRLLALGG